MADDMIMMTRAEFDRLLAARDAALAESEAAAEGALMILAQTMAERDEAQTDLGRIIMSLPTGKGERAVGAVEGVKMMRASLTAERDAALAEGMRIAAKIAGDAASEWWADYKGSGQHAGSPHREGMSDGADEVYSLILARAEKEESKIS